MKDNNVINFKEKIRVEQIESDSGYFEYIVINDSLKNIKNASSYNISISLKFKKENNLKDISNENLFHKTQFKFEKLFDSTTCNLLFAYRKEKKEYREVLFYTKMKNLTSLTLNKLTSSFYCNENLKITIKQDKHWEMYNNFLGNSISQTA